MIAFGQGEWWGVGLGNSVQKLFYLPEAHTDFVFSIWAEETAGRCDNGDCTVCNADRKNSSDRLGAATQGHRFDAYVCFGVALMFSGQAFVNMGASSGLCNQGLTLPFISYGGSSLIVSCVLLGIVLRIAQPLATAKRSMPDTSARVVA